MSELFTPILYVDNKLIANVITVGGGSPVVINSTSIKIGSNVVINTSTIAIGNATANSQFPANINVTSSAVINNIVYQSFKPSEILTNTQIFTANGTWVTPSWWTGTKELVFVHLWGGTTCCGSIATARSGCRARVRRRP